MIESPFAQQGVSALQRGITAARAGLSSVAAAAFERAAELMPDSPEVWNWLAWTSTSPDNALRCLRRAIELNPDDAVAANAVSWLARLSGQAGVESPRQVSTPAIASLVKELPLQEISRDDLVGVSNVVSEPLPEASLSLDVMAKPAHADVFQADAISWEAPAQVESVALVPTPKLESEDAWRRCSLPFPAVVIPPPDTEVLAEEKADAAVNTMATRIAEAVASKVEPTRRPPVAPEPFTVPEPVSSIELPVPPPFTPQPVRRAATDPYADDDPRRFSELVRQAAQMPLPPTPTASSYQVLQSRFVEPSATNRSADFAMPPQPAPVVVPRPALPTRADLTDSLDDSEAVDVDALTRSFRPALFDSVNDGRPVVMVVDDSPTVRKLVSLTLERRGFRVVAAADGVQAIRELGSCRPDLILLDITMPRLDGYRLCKLIKKHEVTQHIPVVMLSGKDGLFDKLRGRLVGCTDYITKPFEADALTMKVTKYLATKVSP